MPRELALAGLSGFDDAGGPQQPRICGLAGAHARPPETVPRHTARTEHPRSRPEPVPAPRRWRMSTQAGMPFRCDRIHRYVNAFCPLCHEDKPDRPFWPTCAGSPGGWSSATNGSGWSVGVPITGWCARCTTSRRRSSATWRSGPRRRRCTRPACAATSFRCRRRTSTGYRRCRPSTLASCCRTCSTTATSSARPASPRARVGTRIGGAAGAGAGVDRQPALPRERPDRRAHAQRRRADALPAARRASRRRRGDTASGSRSTSSTTGSLPRRRPTTGAPTSGGSRSERSSGCPPRLSSPPSR